MREGERERAEEGRRGRKWAGGGGRKRRRREDRNAALHEEHWASRRRRGRERNGGREERREAVIKSDCIASRMSQESGISGDVKPCLTPQLDNCGCGS